MTALSTTAPPLPSISLPTFNAVVGATIDPLPPAQCSAAAFGRSGLLFET
jgi:hypothetical protein